MLDIILVLIGVAIVVLQGAILTVLKKGFNEVIAGLVSVDDRLADQQERR